jgi:hypothetical protein
MMTIDPAISATMEKMQDKKIIHSPSLLFLFKKQRKKTTDNISDKYATFGSNALILHQI